MIAASSAVEFMLEGKVFRRETSLAELEKILDDRLFYHISKRCIVNLAKIEMYESGTILLDGIELKVSARKKGFWKEVFNIWGKLLEWLLFCQRKWAVGDLAFKDVSQRKGGYPWKKGENVIFCKKKGGICVGFASCRLWLERVALVVLWKLILGECV